MPRVEELGKAYSDYYTHADADRTPVRLSRLQAAYWNLNWMIVDGYVQAKYRYTRGVGARWHRLLAPLGLVLSGGVSSLDHEVSYLPAPASGARLLEVGCGDGSQLARKRELGWSVEGLDFDASAVEAAARRGLRVRVGDLAAQKYADSSFDAIYLTHVFEHVPDPRSLLCEAKRVLTPGGILVIQTPNASGWGHRLFGSAWRGLEPPRHLTLHTRASARRLSEEAGFVIQELMTTPRIAKFIWKRSLSLAPGRFQYLRRIPQQIGGLLFEFAERVALHVQPDAGEELVVIVRRPTN